MIAQPGDHFAGMVGDESSTAPLADPVVHVRVVDLGLCRPAIVLSLPFWPDSEVRARVFSSSRFGPVGYDDAEGVYRPSDNPRVVSGSTDGSDNRTLDHWHRASECPFV